ncbi:MAG: N-acetylmuramoyl-L-alanine amidase family protein [Fimbriimonadaceae bacterium]|jgi:N-acetylmuramoyl-L-alanine amidase|nr:N-acetylmuramoyl-L-alanine amidase family protein [Fimbriimonadaceae bacterium]
MEIPTEKLILSTMTLNTTATPSLYLVWKTLVQFPAQMRIWLACLVPWMAMTAALGQVPNAVNIDYSYKGSFPSQGIRVEDECFVSPDLLTKLGWAITVRDNQVVASAETRDLRAPLRTIEGRSLVSLSEFARQLGAKTDWDATTHSFSMRGAIRNIEVTDFGVRLDSTLRVQPNVFRLSNPDRIVIDLKGASIEPRFTQGLPDNWRVSQFTSDTVRVVIEHGSLRSASFPSRFEPTRMTNIPLPPVLVTHARQNWGKNVVLIPEEGTVLVGDGHTTDGRPPAPTQVPLRLSQPAVTDGAGQFTLSIGADRPPVGAPTIRYLTPTSVQVTLRNSQWQGEAAPTKFTSPFVKSVDYSSDANSVTLVLELNFAMAFTATVRNSQFQIAFRRPPSSGGLRGKVIVIDPGHGGRDPGATTAGVSEKTIVLLTSREIARALEREGASVILTRDDDTFIPLNERPAIANRSGAGLFISVHANSNRLTDSRSGSITFFHRQDPMGRLLAECIQAELAQRTGIPGIGAWSDSRIYSSGFAVLRGAQMPAVLLELGFVNHWQDRARMQTQEFRERAAQAVVNGIKTYFGDAK